MTLDKAAGGHFDRASSLPLHFQVELPEWLVGFVANWQRSHSFETESDRVRLAIAIAAENVRLKTGGPFGACVFDQTSSTLIAVGANVVVPSGLSFAHAEVMALSLAQEASGTHDLRQGDALLELATSAEPCLMCLGAIHWSGVRRVVAAARDEDVRAIGFDEGIKPDDWQAALNSVGISTDADVLRDDAVAVLQSYRNEGGELYNGVDTVRSSSGS